MATTPVPAEPATEHRLERGAGESRFGGSALVGTERPGPGIEIEIPDAELESLVGRESSPDALHARVAREVERS
ncbi:MAG TPA: hypothetical protein VF520_12925 [Thermoleophilaceae bacterium]